MKSQLRHVVASALYPTKSYNLPSVCERYGLEPGTGDEAFSSKTRYVMSRLEKLSDEQVFHISKQVVADFPDDKLQAVVEQLEKDGCASASNLGPPWPRAQRIDNTAEITRRRGQPSAPIETL